MAIRTYYHILGVSREATLEEITAAKNALAKVYHPDANMNSGIDTTAYMQEILEAYRILSNPESRARYDRRLSGGSTRVFRTFTMKEENTTTEDTPSFVTYWATAGKLNEIVAKSAQLLEQASKNESLSQKILKKIGKSTKSEIELLKQLEQLSLQALTHISTLKNADIPMDYWQAESMNWILVHWSKKSAVGLSYLVRTIRCFSQPKQIKHRTFETSYPKQTISSPIEKTADVRFISVVCSLPTSFAPRLYILVGQIKITCIPRVGNISGFPVKSNNRQIFCSGSEDTIRSIL